MNLKMMKRAAACIAALFCMQVSAVYPVTFAEDENLTTSIENDDPEKFRVTSSMNLSEATVTSPDEITHNAKFDENYLLFDGIDVSKYQPEVDWEAVAADGIDFVIIRLGYRGYGSAGNIKLDNYFEQHISGAIAAGIDVGVYFFTQATTVFEAVEEANFVIENLNGYELSMPVYIDIESITYDTGRLDTAALSSEQHTAICDAFCATVEQAGYRAGVYANKYWLTEKLHDEYLSERYEIWLANYTNETTYEGTYQTWQYTEGGTVAGISSNVDRNVRYSRICAFEEETCLLTEAIPMQPVFYGDGLVTFTSSDESVAIIDNYGFITPINNGTVTIQAVSDNGTEASLEVTVDVPPVALNQKQLRFSSLGLTEPLFTFASDLPVTWASDDTSVATVSQEGIVEAVSDGVTTISATDDDGNVSACEVIVMTQEIEIGDCNADGQIDAVDAAEVLIYAAASGASESIEIDEAMLPIYDVNCDGTIDTIDAAEILIISVSASAGE